MAASHHPNVEYTSGMPAMPPAHLPAILSERSHTRERSPSVVYRIVSGTSSQNCGAHRKPYDTLADAAPQAVPTTKNALKQSAEQGTAPEQSKAQ